MWAVAFNGTETKVYRQTETISTVVVWDDTTLIPSKIHEGVFEGEQYYVDVEYNEDLYAEVEANKLEWLAKAKDFEISQMSKRESEQRAKSVLHEAQLIFAAPILSNDELHILAPICDEWKPNMSYKKDYPLVWNQQMYLTVQSHVSQAHQPPDSPGMLAVYRPVNNGHKGTLNDPVPWVYGMDCHTGTYYLFNNRVYMCRGDMIPCVWAPGSPGVHQWDGPVDTE